MDHIKVNYTATLQCPHCLEKWDVQYTEKTEKTYCSACGDIANVISINLSIKTPYLRFVNEELVKFIPNHPMLYYNKKYENITNGNTSKLNQKHVEFIQKNHFSETELFSLRDTIAAFLIPRLKWWLQDGLTGYPSALNSEEEWAAILQQILEAMELIIEDDFELSESKTTKVKTGCKLLGDWFLHLWT